MAKIKTKPSARLERRHILFKGSKKDVEKTILEYIGVLGWGKAAPVFVKLKKFPEKSLTAKLGNAAKLQGTKSNLTVGQGTVLSVNRKSLEDIRAAFELSDRDIKIVAVSGTLKGLERKV